MQELGEETFREERCEIRVERMGISCASAGETGKESEKHPQMEEPLRNNIGGERDGIPLCVGKIKVACTVKQTVVVRRRAS